MKKAALTTIVMACVVLLAGCAVIPLPEADFGASPTSGPVPLTVQFTDRSSGATTSWVWDFGDGNTSTAQNPTHTYTAGGKYTVSLKVSGSGGSDTATKTDYIQVEEGGLPSRNVGDRWVYKVLSDSTEYTYTEVVTGEEMVDGRDCWTEDYLSEPPMDGTGTVKVWTAKATIFPLKMEGSGVSQGHSYTYVTTYFYKFPEGWSWWPLVVGKRGQVQETKTTTVTSGGQVVSTETKVTDNIYEVEMKEEIQVPAGKFIAFKIVEKGKDGTVYRVYWYSDKVANDVKGIEYANGQASAWVPASLMELKSYSLRGGR